MILLSIPSRPRRALTLCVVTGHGPLHYIRDCPRRCRLQDASRTAEPLRSSRPAVPCHASIDCDSRPLCRFSVDLNGRHSNICARHSAHTLSTWVLVQLHGVYVRRSCSSNTTRRSLSLDPVAARDVIKRTGEVVTGQTLRESLGQLIASRVTGARW